MKILLVSAPYRNLYGSSKFLTSYYFPLGLGYIASFLEKNGYECEILAEDGLTDVFQSLKDKLIIEDYLFIGISSMTSSFPSAVNLAKMIREIQPTAKVVLGGSHASAIGAKILREQKEFDIVCIGEGEITSFDLAQSLIENKISLSSVKGIAWRKEDGTVMVNSPREFHEPIDDFPYPARHLVDFKKFSLHGHVTSGGGDSATILTSRGCPFRCIFCSAHLTDGRKYRFHSEDYIINELKLLRDEYSIRHVFFEDDTLTVVRKRIRSLCERIAGENLGMSFGCFSRVDVFDDEMAKILKKANVRMVIFGVESGVPDTLKKIGKGATIDQALKAIAICNRYGIRSFASFVVGFPFETIEQIKETIRFGKNLGATIITFNPFVPFPGTSLFYENMYPLHYEGWANFLTTSAPPFSLVPGLPANKLKKMIDRGHLQFYINPKRILYLLRSISSMHELFILFKGFISILVSVMNKIKK